MDSPAQPPVVIRFGSFELDLAACELRENGALRRLAAQPFRVLALLIERAGDLVTRQEIRRCLWGERKYVDVDDGINFCVNQIRSALRDPAELSRFIKTVPRRGYRFVATITRLTSPQAPAPFIAADSETGTQAAPAHPAARPPDPAARPPDPKPVRAMISRIGAILLPILIVIALSLAPDSSQRRQPLTPRGSVVVADFINTTGDAVFDDTLTQALVIELRQSPTMEVLPDSTVRATLRMMDLPVDQRMTPAVARELCLRAASEAVLGGRISAIGSHYLLSISATECGGGDIVASEQAEAARKDDVLLALSHAASRLRSALGESLPGMARHLDSGTLRRMLYSVAFLRGDRAEMDRQSEWAIGRPGDEGSLLAAQADTEAYFGRLIAARRFLARARDSASRAPISAVSR